MKIPIIIKSNKILDRLGWFMRIGGITLWPWIIIRPYRSNDLKLINHETIHIKQQQELLVILFYLIYILEWFIKLFIYGGPKSAYRNISFEREAYKFESDFDYINRRNFWSWVRYIIKD